MLWSLCWYQCNLFHLIAMDNQCLKWFENSLGKVQLGRPNWKPLPAINFCHKKKKTFSSELHALQHLSARFSILIFINPKKNLNIILVKILNYIYYKYYSFFLYYNDNLSWSLCWCQRNLFHSIAMDNWMSVVALKL